MGTTVVRIASALLYRIMFSIIIKPCLSSTQFYIVCIIYCRYNAAVTSAHLPLSFPVIKLKWQFYHFFFLLISAVQEMVFKGVDN